MGLCLRHHAAGRRHYCDWFVGVAQLVLGGSVLVKQIVCLVKEAGRLVASKV